MCHPFGSDSPSKCVTHLEPFLPPNVYRIWNTSSRTIGTQSPPPRVVTIDAFTGQIASVTQFSTPCNRSRMSLNHAPNMSLIWSTKPFQTCYSFGAKNDAKSVSEMEAKPSKTRMNQPPLQIQLYTFGAVSASKSAAHLEDYSAYRIVETCHPLHHSASASLKQIAASSNFHLLRASRTCRRFMLQMCTQN